MAHRTDYIREGKKIFKKMLMKKSVDTRKTGKSKRIKPCHVTYFIRMSRHTYVEATELEVFSCWNSKR